MVLRVAITPLLFGLSLAGQQYPFVQITGPNAPKGAAFLFEDSRGGMWLGGARGGVEPLTYFDGSRFISVLKNLQNIMVSGMAEDTERGIWMATNQGLYRLYQARLEKILDGVAEDGITNAGHDIFLATIAPAGNHGKDNAVELVRVTRAQAGSWKVETISTMARQVRFQVDGSGTVLYPCPGGFCELRGEAIASWRRGSSLAITRHSLAIRFEGESVARDRFGCIWMRNVSHSMYQCPGDPQPTILPINVASNSNPIILEIDDGSIVLPSIGKFAIGRPDNFRVMAPINGYPSCGYALATKDGSVWLSNGNGLFVFPTRSNMEFWTERDGLNGNTWSILPLGKNTFAIAGETIRVLDRERSRWRELITLDGAEHLSRGPGSTIVVSTESSVLAEISTDGRLVRTRQAVNATTPAQSANFPGPQSKAQNTELDRDGSFWTCDSTGLVHRDSGGLHRISKEDGLLENQCRSFAIDGSGDIWYAYNQFPQFSLIRNPRGDRPLIQHFSSGGEVGTAQSNFFASDDRGWLWRAADDGIYIADSQEARDGEWLHLNREDGLPSNDGNHQSFFEDANGSVWFGAGDTIIHMFPPADLVHPNYAPKVFVSGFSLDGGTFRMAGMVKDIPNGARVVAHIGSLQFDRRNALRLRYRVLPGQRAWKFERSLDIALGKLPQGEHKLEVQARIFTGPWSPSTVESFTVLKPIWFSWPVLMAFGAAGTFAAATGCRWQKKRGERARKLLPALAEWRLAVLSPQNQSLEGALLDGRYQLEKLVARGGFATVYKARDRQQKARACAVKIFRSELLEKTWMDHRFQQEVAALKQIHHPNVVRIYGYGTTAGGAPYLAMEFVRGKTLRDLLKETRLDNRHIASYLRQTGNALDEIHLHGVCHRDLKPENLMIRSKAEVGEELVLIDFSIAIVKDPDETLHGLSRAAGTLYYMAPEQAIGYADASSDIYSLAKILIEMLTGQRLSSLLPDASLDLPARIRDFLTESSSGFSADSIDLIAATLEFDPSRRPKKAGEFAWRIAQDLESSNFHLN